MNPICVRQWNQTRNKLCWKKARCVFRPKRCVLCVSTLACLFDLASVIHRQREWLTLGTTWVGVLFCFVCANVKPNYITASRGVFLGGWDPVLLCCRHRIILKLWCLHFHIWSLIKSHDNDRWDGWFPLNASAATCYAHLRYTTALLQESLSPSLISKIIFLPPAAAAAGVQFTPSLIILNTAVQCLYLFSNE